MAACRSPARCRARCPCRLADLQSRPSTTLAVTLECAGQRPSPVVAPPGVPALAPRGGRDRRVDRRAAADAPRGGGRLGRRRRGPLPRARPRRRGRRAAALRALVDVGGRDARRGAPGVGDERRGIAAPARLPTASGRPRLVRHDERQVARHDHGDRRAVRRLPAVPRLPAAADPRRAGRAGHADGAEVADDPAGRAGLRHARADRRRRAGASFAAARGQGTARSPPSRSAPTAARHGAPPASARRLRRGGHGADGSSTGTRRRRATTSSAAAPPTTPATPSRSSRPGTSAATRTTSRTACR